MKKLVVLTLFYFCFFSFPITTFSQLDIGADIVSRYLWRGQLLASGPAIQPSISYQTGGFTVGAWGSYGIANSFDGTEADIYFTYEAGDFSATLTDYYFPSDGTGANFDNFFDYDESTTRHVLEFMLGYDPGGVPIKFDAAYDFYGADPDDSFWIRLTYSLGDNTDLALEVGNGWYTFENAGESDAFGIVGIGITHEKEIKFSDSYALPVFGSVVINPESEKFFIVFGLSF